MSILSEIKDFFEKSVTAVADFLGEDVSLDYDVELAKKMAAGAQKEYGWTADEAEDFGIMVAQAKNMAMGFTGAAAEQRGAKIAKKAFGKIAQKAGASGVNKKIFAKLAELEEKVGAKINKSPKTFLQKLSAQPLINYILAGMVVSQLDFNLWGTDKVASLLDHVGLGKAYRSLFYNKIGLTFSNSQAEDLAQALERDGYKYLFDIYTNERMELNQANMGKILDEARQKIVATGGKFDMNDTRRLAVKHAGREKEYKPEVGKEEIGKAFSTIKVSGISFGQVLVPPKILDRIQTPKELGDATKSIIMQYLNSMPDRLSFELRRVTNWVTKTGQVIRPNPPFFTEREEKDGTVISRTIKNRIVVLDIYSTTQQNKRVKIFTAPLDYSLADNVITPPPEGLEAPLPVTVEITKQIITPTKEAEAQPSPAAPAVTVTPGVTTPATALPPTPVTVTKPKPKPPVTVTKPKPKPPKTTWHVANTGGQGLNIRSGPSTRGRKITAVPDGTALTFITNAGHQDGYDWAAIKVASTGQFGFVAKDFII